MITDLMTNEEVLAFARVLAERDEGFIELSYQEIATDDTRNLEPAFRFYERVAEAARRPIIYQVVAAFADQPEHHRQVIRWLEDCTRRGLRLYGQSETHKGGFEFTFNDWNLFDRSPGWRDVTVGTSEERKRKMQDPERRRVLRAEWDEGSRPGAGIADGSLEGLVVAEVGHRELEHYLGEKLGDIAKQEGKHVVDALLDLVVEDDLQTELYALRSVNSPEYTGELVRSSHVIPGTSDGGAHVKFVTFGRFPTEMLIWLVRDEGVVSLEQAHYSLSYLPAFFGGFKDRGFIREGAPADIVVYDMEKLNLLPIEVAHDFPAGEWRRVQRAEGYRWIMVNGQVTLEDGVPTGATPGKLLRHGRG
jgi:N-acyl-D-aspartate/D-glutamate deacylase